MLTDFNKMCIDPYLKVVFLYLCSYEITINLLLRLQVTTCTPLVKCLPLLEQTLYLIGFGSGIEIPNQINNIKGLTEVCDYLVIYIVPLYAV